MFLIIVFFTSLHLLAHLFHLLSHLTPSGSSLPAFSYQFACSPLVEKTGTDCLKALTEVHLTLLASLFPSFLDHFPKVQNPPKSPQRIDHFKLLLPSFPENFPKSPDAGYLDTCLSTDAFFSHSSRRLDSYNCKYKKKIQN